MRSLQTTEQTTEEELRRILGDRFRALPAQLRQKAAEHRHWLTVAAQRLPTRDGSDDAPPPPKRQKKATKNAAATAAPAATARTAAAAVPAASFQAAPAVLQCSSCSTTTTVLPGTRSALCDACAQTAAGDSQPMSQSPTRTLFTDDDLKSGQASDILSAAICDGTIDGLGDGSASTASQSAAQSVRQRHETSTPASTSAGGDTATAAPAAAPTLTASAAQRSTSVHPSNRRWDFATARWTTAPRPLPATTAVTPRIRHNLCEACGLTSANYGMPFATRRRWCAACAQPRGGILECGWKR